MLPQLAKSEGFKKMAMKTHQTITKVQAEAAPKLAKMEAAAAEKVSKHRDDGDGVPPPTPARARAANYAPTSHQPVCCAAQSPLCGFVFRVACVFLAHGAGVTVRDLLPRNNVHLIVLDFVPLFAFSLRRLRLPPVRPRRSQG